MADIRIKVGVALDRDVKSVYQPVVDAANKAAKQIARALNAGHALSVAGAKKAFESVPEAIAAPHRKGAKKASDELAKVTAAEEREANRRKRIREKEEREKQRAQEKMVREFERTEQQKTRAAEREASKRTRAAEKEGERNARRTAYWSMRNFSPVTPTLSMGRRMAGDVLRGAGVELNAGAMIGDFVGREKLATQLTSGAWIGGHGNKSVAINGSEQRVDPKVLMREANQVALETGMEGGSTALLSGLQAFVSKTGDLKTARDIMKDLAVFSKATGTSMDDALAAAADMANAMPEGVDKAASIKSAMLALGGQGQVGAVEIRMLSSSMGKLAGQATNFTVGKDTEETLKGAGLNDRTSQNIAIMGALTQAARAKGGRTSATLATNSAMSFIADMSNQTTMKRWQAAGISTFTDKSATQVRDPKALIMDIMNKTQGNLGEITKLMPNKNSRAVLQAFSKEYQIGANQAPLGSSAAQKHQAGLDEVSKKFDSYLKVTMSAKEINEKFNIAMNTSATKAAVFNQKMQMIADRMTEKLLPAVEKLAPKAEALGEAFGNFLVWATDHPGQAIGVALTASITKAALDNTIRSGIENILKTSTGTNGMGKAAQVGSALAIAAVAITTAQIGMAYIDKLYDDSNKRTNDALIASGNAAGSSTRALMTGQVSEEEAAALKQQLDDLKQKREQIKANPQGEDAVGRGIRGFTDNVLHFTPAAIKEAQDRNAAEQARLMKSTDDSIKRLEKVMKMIEGGSILKVKVVNQPPTPPDPNSTAPVPAKVGE